MPSAPRENFGQLAAVLDSSGKSGTHRTNDIWIAAAAIQLNLKVLTRNEKYFADNPGLDLIVM